MKSGLLGRFCRDQRGGVAVIFAASGIALCLLTGGGIEMYRRSLALAVMQKATDAAALAAKRFESDNKVSVSEAAARQKGTEQAREIFKVILTEDGRVFGESIPVPTVEWFGDGSVKVTANGAFGMLFGGLLPDSFAKIETTATAGHAVPLPTEVALVLDNTASMFNKDSNPQTRFTQLRDAAKMFTHTLFDAAQQLNNKDFLRISVVPWTTTVNVKGEAPRPPDFSGSASITSIPDRGSGNFVKTPILHSGEVTIDQTAFGPAGWRGCISGQGESQSPDPGAVSSWKALNIPAPALTMTSVGRGQMRTVKERQCSYDSTETPCYNGGGGNPGPGPGSSGGGGTQGFNDLLRRVLPQIEPAALLGDRLKDYGGAADPAACYTYTARDCKDVDVERLVCSSYTSYVSCSQNIAGGRLNPYTKTSMTCATSSGCFGPNDALPLTTVGPCVGDPNEPGLANGSLSWCPWVPQTSWTQHDPIAGPNINCPAPMLGLSGNRRQILETLDRMSPVPGGTHNDVGLRWGLRTLTSTGNWPAFFGLDKPPAAFNGQEKKVMILITDGANEQAIDYPGYWGCSGYQNPGCSGSPDKLKLDQMMLSWCQEIRTKHNVELFTIAVKIRDQGALNLLKACAGKEGRFYSVDATELKNVLNIIAGSIIKLRLLS